MKNIITDGAKIVGEVAFNFCEVIPIFPITPSTPMAEQSSLLSAKGRKNILGEEVKTIEMQSEAGVSGTLHGALLSGASACTFTSSQGLLLMIPNMFKMAGENLPAVIHVSARSVATHALNIFCDHSDVMSTRMTGFNMIVSSSPQEAQDMAFISHAVSLSGGGSTMHFFDGFRTSHEIQKILPIDKDVYSPFIDKIKANKNKYENDTNQYGTAQNPDVFFQGRENTTERHLDGLKEIISLNFDYFYKNTARNYSFFEYYGHKDAENIIVAMGSSCNTIEEYIDANADKKIGLIKVRVYRPFYSEEFIKSLPSTCKNICVLERVKEVGALNPLTLDVIASLSQNEKKIKVISGRYGLGGKDFTPACVNAVYENLNNQKIDNFAVGIFSNDNKIKVLDVPNYQIKNNCTQIKIFGLGSDGSVSASKSTIQILGEQTEKFVQGYFEYDSKKSGSLTISHLRLSDKAIKSSYLLQEADLISINNFSFVHRYDCLEGLKHGGTVLINSIFSAQEIGKVLPKKYVKILQEKNAKLFVINGHKIAKECGLGEKINIVMQTALFKVSQILSTDSFVEEMKKSITKIFSRKGESVINKNINAMEMSLNSAEEVDVSSLIGKEYPAPREKDDEFYNNIMKPIASMQGNLIPAELIDEKAPIGTSKFEKRGIASNLPKWIKENCIQCGQCVLACPHSALRAILTEEKAENFANALGIKDALFKIQLSPEDCTGCGVCSKTCPALKKALEMVDASEILEQEKENYAKSLSIKQKKQTLFSTDFAKGLQFERAYFEFPGACAGCGETPYIKLASTLFKDKMVIANATGCSSIYSGTFGACPIVKDENGNGIKWANSLFEDNAEFGLGMKLGNDFTKNKDKSTWIIGGDGWAYDIGFGGLDHILASGENVNILVLDNETYSNTGGQASKSTPMGSNVKLAENSKRTHKKNLGQIALSYKNVYVAQVAIGANMNQCIKAFKEAEKYDGVSLIIAYSTCVNQGFDLSNLTSEMKKAVDCGYFPLYRYNPPEHKLYLDSGLNEDCYFDFLKGERRYQITVENFGNELLEKQKQDAVERYQLLKDQSDN